jgi:hypothetical protein
MTDLTVARSILDQLGGERFVAMTGARELVGSADSLTFKIGVNPKRVSLVRVTLTRRRSKATSIATCSKQFFPSAPASPHNFCGPVNKKLRN